ncbi:MAG: hypothetical protein KGI02_10500 [Thaumarchaeota archaeon]|nr:hypothetical protein [Nitrososphaerota archaeon]MDE1832778.1 hypothetical protein [Nitrososphaerota archaeon]MDE1878885.1 hypothetical protein [Nitrososphaerota archaeon]
MRKGIMIAIGVVILAIAGIALGLSGDNTAKDKTIPNPVNVTLSQSPEPQGRHLSITLSENVGIGAH